MKQRYETRDHERLAQLGGEVLSRTLQPALIDRWQREIYLQTLTLSRSIDRPNFRQIGRDDLVRMVRMYDDRFFGSSVLPLAQAERLSFGISARMTKAAGKLVTTYPDGDYGGTRHFDLVVSSTLLFQTFEDDDRDVDVTGCRCRDRLEALQRVVEHELVHLIEMLVWNDGTCSGNRFQSIAHRYFGHTDYRHELITQRERAWKKFDIRLGDRVQFYHRGQTLTGHVNRITQRATVLVSSRRGRLFSDGRRYQRYYVPLERLRKIT